MTLLPLPSFREVFQATHGYEPYPWQVALADQVVAEGRWPRTIGVPTGTGKTATLDIALYALAHDPSRAPRRIVMVVDRRTIVDQSFARAQLIQKRLAATEGPLEAMRQRLLALMGPDRDHEEPMQLALLRGGVPRDDGWARRPDQALVALSTVDQVGSRLLFRGYGVRPTMQSLHAGLLGQDTLFLLDEVHLSRPFFETLSAVEERWRTWHERSLPERWQIVSLSATSGADEPFQLTDNDRTTDRLRRRLSASKPVTTELATSSTHDRQGRPHKKWIATLQQATRAHLDAGRRCIGVVVNRVDTARTLATAIEGKGVEVQLVTGRMRGADRVEAARRLEQQAGPGWRDRQQPGSLPYVCVATQCIEAGADLDFDAMVTEAAALDALVQRFGRANRTGDHDQAPITIVAPKDVEGLDDPIYGLATGSAWRWLEAQGAFDASTARLEELLKKPPTEAMAPQKSAAVLLPTHLDLLAQTGPVPHPDPEPGLYLHGLEPPRPEVQIVWRADVELPGEDELATRRLIAVPPTAFEAMSLPLGAARRWLAGEDAGSFGDAGGDSGAADDIARRTKVGLVAFLWSGSDATAVTPRGLRPGCTLVVPASRGGIRGGTFDPTCADPVADVGDLGRTIRTGRPVARLDDRVYDWPSGLSKPPPFDAANQTRREALAALRGWFDAVPDSLAGPLGMLLSRLRATGFDADWVDGVWVLSGSRRRPLTKAEVLRLAKGEVDPPGDEALTADEGSSVSNRPIGLDVHLEGVESWARGLAAACGVSQELTEDLARAGRWHDLGKAHPRFQVLLHGGDEIRAAGGEVLAKSGTRLADRAARTRAWERAGLPGGFRHEMASVALLTSSEEGRALLDEAHDPDLVLHLVASHHGFGRPFAPLEDHSKATACSAVEVRVGDRVLVAPADHSMDRLDSGVAERFWRVQRRYGWWGLAWLEAILRLADHRESEVEERAVEEGP